MKTSTDYTNRQVDVELLQTVVTPEGTIPVSLSNVSKPPKVVAGIEKLAQRYTLLLLTTAGEVKFAQDEGGSLLALVLGGAVQDLGQLQYAFAQANNAVVAMLNDDDLNTDTFGAVPQDEQISGATLLNSSVNKATATAYLQVRITSQAGTSFTFLVPITETST